MEELKPMEELVVEEEKEIDPFLELQQEQNALRFSAVSTGSFFWRRILYAIPVIGWIICAIHAVSQKNINRRNFARATLIGIIAGILVFCIGAWCVFQAIGDLFIKALADATGTKPEQVETMVGALGTVVEVTNEIKDGKHDELLNKIEKGEFGDHPELNNMVDKVKDEGAKGLVDQIVSGDAKDVVDKYINGDYNEIFDKMESGEFGDLDDMGALGDLYESVKDNGGMDILDDIYEDLTNDDKPQDPPATQPSVPQDTPDATQPSGGEGNGEGGGESGNSGNSGDSGDSNGSTDSTNPEDIYNDILNETIPPEIDDMLSEDEKDQLADSIDQYKEMGYERFLEKYINGDYDELLDEIYSGKYGDVDIIMEMLMAYIAGGN